MNKAERFVVSIFLGICISGIWLSFLISEYLKPINTSELTHTLVGLGLTSLGIGSLIVFFSMAKELED